MPISGPPPVGKPGTTPPGNFNLIRLADPEVPYINPPLLGWNIPDIESNPTFDGQSLSDLTDYQSMMAAGTGTGLYNIASGSCLVIPNFANPQMQVQVNPGTGLIQNTSFTLSSPVVLTVPASNGVSDRRDIVVYDSWARGPALIRGSECATTGANWTRSGGNPYGPVKPQLTSSQALLAEIYVGYQTTSILTTNIIDKRKSVWSSPVNYTQKLGEVVYNPSASVTVSTTSATFTAIDSVNLAVSFTAPTNGNVIVILTAWSYSGNTTTYAWALNSAGSQVIQANLTYDDNGTGSGGLQRTNICYFKVTGLTPGASYAYTWMHANVFGSGSSATIYGGSGGAGNSYGSAIMQVWGD